MRKEIVSGANFIASLLRSIYKIGDVQLEMFKDALIELLCLRYKNHWYPDMPVRGSGFRCIRMDWNADPIIIQAGRKVDLPHRYLQGIYPAELSVWIDPECVSYRLADNGPICVVYDKKTDIFAGPESLAPLFDNIVREARNFSQGWSSPTSTCDFPYAVILHSYNDRGVSEPTVTSIVQPMETARNIPSNVVPYITIEQPHIFQQFPEELYEQNYYPAFYPWAESPP